MITTQVRWRHLREQAVKAAFAALDGGEFYTDPLIEVPEDVSRA